jgi:hypothetical protein
MQKRQLTQSEISQLTPSEKAKYRRLMKSFDDSIRPISQARWQREEEVRRTAWIERGCAGRIDELEKLYRPQLAELEEQRKAIAKQYQEMLDKLSELRLDIQAEVYEAAHADAQGLAMKAILSQMYQAHEAKLAELVASFKIEEVA